MSRTLSYRSTSPSHPARAAVLVKPEDNNDLAEEAKALRIWNPGSGAAVIRVLPLDADMGVLALTVPPGLTVEPLMVRRVLQTGTEPALVIHALQR
ncbi:spike base protein, RCAP_Rcc01079 family [Aureimonas psammosilenae]|uniref:spike base protein, RCAP_Rcc01079 family n=1 Tax=Aureimonas psammosilenae TaxID=2495496 RepID=UPI00126086D7|nr:hypothetical protein [Aureimonas psammosilenae]